MFQRLAIRLTLVNAGAIGVVVIALLAATFFGVRYSLEENASARLEDSARAIAFDEAARSLGVAPSSSLSTPLGRWSAESEEEEEEEHEGDEEERAEAAEVSGDARLQEGPSSAPGSMVWALFDPGGEVIAGPGLAVEHTPLPQRRALQRAMGGSWGESVVDGEDGPYRVMTLPLWHEGRIAGVLQVAASEAAEQRTLSTLMGVLAAVGGTGLAGAAGLGWFLSGRSLVPIRRAFDRQRAFIADASHELRTPIAVIRADADALSRTLQDLPSEDAQLLQDLQHESENLGAIVTRLLDVARLDESPASASVTEVFDLRDVARECATSMTRVAESAGLTMGYDGPSQELPVHADRMAIRLALMALLDNAIKYNQERGRVAVSARRQGRRAVVVVEDAGQGIPAEHLPWVSERFYRVDKARSRANGGVGLGLTIARDTIERFGGSLKVESREGVGTSVTVELPLAHPGHDRPAIS